MSFLIKGTLADSDGNPLAGYTVKAFDEDAWYAFQDDDLGSAGTYATYQEHDKSVKLPLMIVPRKVPPYSDNFTKKIKFYTTALNLMEDPEGLGYGIYQPLLSNKLNPFSL